MSITKRLLFILLLINPPNIGWACSCISISKKEAKKISRKADYVLLGSAIENIHPNDTIKEYWDKLQEGYHVKFKVDEVYKGRIDAEFIFINQFETGNCIELFEFGKKYIIVGTRIKEFENVRPLNAREEFREDELFETFIPPPPPPPIGGLTINKMKCYNEEETVVEYWNEIAKKEIVVYTNQCSSFYQNSTYGKYFDK